MIPQPQGALIRGELTGLNIPEEEKEWEPEHERGRIGEPPLLG